MDALTATVGRAADATKAADTIEASQPKGKEVKNNNPPPSLPPQDPDTHDDFEDDDEEEDQTGRRKKASISQMLNETQEEDLVDWWSDNLGSTIRAVPSSITRPRRTS